MFRSSFLLLLTGFVFLLSAPASALVSNTIPLESWVYPALEKLEGLGLIDSAMAGTRPFTRLEALRQVQEAQNNIAVVKAPAVAPEIIDRLLSFLDDELQDGAGGNSYFKPLRELRLDYLYKDGQKSGIPATNARQFALNTNNNGVDYSEQHNAQLIFESEARLGKSLLLSVRPLLEFQQDGASGSAHLLHGKAALALGPFEVSVGRQSLWWGQGRHGSLILTNNAKPLDMVRITNPSPLLLPWIFKYLGPFRFDVFWSELDEDRVVPEPYFAGLRFNAKPLPWFEIGASRTVMFGGEGQPSIGADEFLTILGGKNLEGGEDTSNSIAALDARLRLPFLWGAEIYGEYGGEDEAGQFFSKQAWIAGLYLPRIEPSGRLSLRLEYADFSKTYNNFSPWYRHSLYNSGYTYEGQLMGHHVGGGATDLSVELQMFLSNKLTVSLLADYEQRGFDQDIKEKHHQGVLKADWELDEKLTVSARYGMDKIDNFEFESGNDKTHHMASIGLHGRW